MPRSRFSKHANAVERATNARCYLTFAIRAAEAAYVSLDLCGYRGAKFGVGAATDRLRDWQMKIDKAIAEEEAL